MPNNDIATDCQPNEMIDTVDPVILRNIMTMAIISLQKDGKPVPVDEIARHIEGDIGEMIGIQPESMQIKRGRRMQIVPCFTTAHLDALLAKSAEIMQGLCDGSIHSEVWCPECEGYQKIGDKWVYFLDIKEGSSCDINYGKKTGQTR